MCICSEQVGPGIVMADVQMVEGLVAVKMERVVGDFCEEHVKPTSCATSGGCFLSLCRFFAFCLCVCLLRSVIL